MVLGVGRYWYDIKHVGTTLLKNNILVPVHQRWSNPILSFKLLLISNCVRAYHLFRVHCLWLTHWLFLLQFGGAADLMLLCDGENCEEAFHSFCLKLPLQSIPEGDWLCPLCLEEKQTTSKTSKKTSKMRAKLIPTLKKAEAIIGWRDDPSTVSSENKEDRKLQYLVKWTSLSHRHDTWVRFQSK